MIIRYQMLGLRAVTLVCRLGLTALLAAYTTPREAGVFALYWAVVGMTVGLIGADVYSNTIRDILTGSLSARELIRLQAGFIILTLAVFVPIATCVFCWMVPSEGYLLACLFPFHLAFEYTSQEAGRFLIPLGRPLVADSLLFVRSALWIPVAFVLLFVFDSLDPVPVLIGLWLLGSTTAFLLAAVFAYSRLKPKLVTLDFVWIWGALKCSCMLFLGTLFFRSILGFDRFVVEYFLGIEVLGIYAVQASVALGALPLIEASISAWRYPKMVAALRAKEFADARRRLRVFLLESVVGSAGIAFAIGAIVPSILAAIGRVEYLEDLRGFYAIVGGVFFYGATMPFHYGIYALNGDRYFPVIYAAAFLVLSSFTLIFLSHLGLFGAGLMLGLSLTVIAFLRAVVSRWLWIGREQQALSIDSVQARRFF